MTGIIKSCIIRLLLNKINSFFSYERNFSLFSDLLVTIVVWFQFLWLLLEHYSITVKSNRLNPFMTLDNFIVVCIKGYSACI